MAAPDPMVIEQREELARCAEAVAMLAEHRDIEPVHVSKVKHDRQTRKVLNSIVGLYTRLVWTSYFSEAASEDGAQVHRDHIVPVRVLIDHMITNPLETSASFAPSLSRRSHLRNLNASAGFGRTTRMCTP